jgi:hypothetical protein
VNIRSFTIDPLRGDHAWDKSKNTGVLGLGKNNPDSGFIIKYFLKYLNIVIS